MKMVVLNAICSYLICNSAEKEPLFQYINDVTVGDIISLISVLLVIVGGIFGYIQWQKSIKIQRSEFLNELAEKIRTDEDISQMVYILDYDTEWYLRSFHQSGKFEWQMDKTLSYFSYICYMFENNLIEDREFDFFKYEIDRILINPSTVNYFYNLYHFSEQCGTPMSFVSLFKYGQKANIYDEAFYDPGSKKYPHYLNFEEKLEVNV